MTELPSCTIKRLPDHLAIEAAEIAIAENPLNHPMVGPSTGPFKQTVSLGERPTAERIAFMATKWWRKGSVSLAVGFMEDTSTDLANRILSHMNAWSKHAAIKFFLSTADPEVRISRGSGGYWSYLGTDILSVPANEPTMNLEGFTMQTADSEFYRVVRHETGHTLGCPHEHMRSAIVAQINQQAAIKYFRLTQGWSRQEVIQQVLTPITEDNYVFATPTAEQDSIMCYQLPGSIMKDGKPVPGGLDITPSDYDACGLLYPVQIA